MKADMQEWWGFMNDSYWAPIDPELLKFLEKPSQEGELSEKSELNPKQAMVEALLRVQCAVTNLKAVGTTLSLKS